MDISQDQVGNAAEGDLDVNLAELSLGQRLQGLGDARASSSSDEDDAVRKPLKQKQRDSLTVPADSLSRTLTQALHSSDARLLETCLAHSNQTLIRNTVRSLPPQLAVPLIQACVERLGRGHAGANLKGGGGGASAQRGSTLIKWVKAVLIAHTAHLMTVSTFINHDERLRSQNAFILRVDT